MRFQQRNAANPDYLVLRVCICEFRLFYSKFCVIYFFPYVKHALKMMFYIQKTMTFFTDRHSS